MLAAKGTPLYNFYGPTETTVWSTFQRFESPSEPLVIGRPLANTQVYIVDRDGNPVPAGVPGEILIGGDGVAKGYLNQSELTAEKFIPDRFSTNAEARLYRTGDLGKYLHDGRIQFAGRIDHQVKIRGYRVELGEIETVLGSHPSVQECVVIAREDVPGDKRLVGYVVSAAGTRIDPSELRLWVKESLPDYMIPVAWVEMERLPLSPNGKIDRKNLPVPDYLRQEFSGEFQQPRTPTEEVIAVIWAEVLKLDQVGSQDDFFELGGHSLLATQVMSRIRQAFQLDLPLRALFENPNVAALAECVETMQRRTDGFLSPPIQPVPRDRPLPLSFPQQRLWVQDQIEPNNPLYNIPRALRLKGILNLQALDAALNAIIERHEIMRTTYRSDDAGHPFQVIEPAHKAPLPVVDLSDMPVGDREKEARRIAQNEAATPFNLASDPMTRNLLLQMDDEDHILLMITHHIASDGWSTGILLRELSALYIAALNGTPSALPALPIQYADFAVWQRNWLQGEVLEQQLTYWRTRLAGAPPLLALPSDRPRSTTSALRGVMHNFLLPKDLVDAVRVLGRHNSATAFMTLLAAFECMILYFTRDPDIVVGTDLANRTNIQTEGLIGFFVNLLVLRTDLSGDPTFEELLGRVREVALGAYAHQDVPFDKLVEELQPERNTSYHPLVQVLFVQQNAHQIKSIIAGVEVLPYMLDVPSKFDMAIFVSETDKGISGIWLYNPDLFDPTTIARMSNLYQLVLKTVTDNPTLRLDNLIQLLAETEQQERAMLSKEFQEISLQKLKNFKRKAITLN
jgi:acyl carrier protein